VKVQPALGVAGPSCAPTTPGTAANAARVTQQDAIRPPKGSWLSPVAPVFRCAPAGPKDMAGFYTAGCSTLPAACAKRKLSLNFRVNAERCCELRW
jgi:hypothetical protein